MNSTNTVPAVPVAPCAINAETLEFVQSEFRRNLEREIWADNVVRAAMITVPGSWGIGLYCATNGCVCYLPYTADPTAPTILATLPCTGHDDDVIFRIGTPNEILESGEWSPIYY